MTLFDLQLGGVLDAPPLPFFFCLFLAAAPCASGLSALLLCSCGLSVRYASMHSSARAPVHLHRHHIQHTTQKKETVWIKSAQRAAI